MDDFRYLFYESVRQLFGSSRLWRGYARDDTNPGIRTSGRCDDHKFLLFCLYFHRPFCRISDRPHRCQTGDCNQYADFKYRGCFNGNRSKPLDGLHFFRFNRSGSGRTLGTGTDTGAALVCSSSTGVCAGYHLNRLWARLCHYGRCFSLDRGAFQLALRLVFSG